jgi:cleavage and polyadenylation specificity factor subunit 5
LKPEEDPIEGLKRILDEKLAPPGEEDKRDWNVGELLAVWWRPGFETIMVRTHNKSLDNMAQLKYFFLFHGFSHCCSIRTFQL